MDLQTLLPFLLDVCSKLIGKAADYVFAMRARRRAVLEALAPSVSGIIEATDWFDLDSAALNAAIAGFRQKVNTAAVHVSKTVADELRLRADELQWICPTQYERIRDEVDELVRGQLCDQRRLLAA